METPTPQPIETHPFEPWLPKNARLLMLGTFPPAPKRWCMAWYYPNFQNDMWRIFGHVFFGDKLHFVDQEHKTFHLKVLKTFLAETGVAIFDTAAGQLATQVFMQHFSIKQMPKMGCFAEFSFEGRTLRLYRVPSSSRAYPMAVEKKAAFYQKMFDDVLHYRSPHRHRLTT